MESEDSMLIPSWGLRCSCCKHAFLTTLKIIMIGGVFLINRYDWWSKGYLVYLLKEEDYLDCKYCEF